MLLNAGGRATLSVPAIIWFVNLEHPGAKAVGIVRTCVCRRMLYLQTYVSHDCEDIHEAGGFRWHSFGVVGAPAIEPWVIFGMQGWQVKDLGLRALDCMF